MRTPRSAHHSPSRPSLRTASARGVSASAHGDNPAGRNLAQCAATIVQCGKRSAGGGRAARLVALGGAAALLTMLLRAAVRTLRWASPLGAPGQLPSRSRRAGEAPPPRPPGVFASAAFVAVPRAPRLSPPAPRAPPPYIERFRAVAGSRYVSWLPSFSVEVTRVRPPPPHHHQLDAMARQVREAVRCVRAPRGPERSANVRRRVCRSRRCSRSTRWPS